ncbi:relaxase/mobilization nuclease domain-containing protein [Dysosmobacter sp.]|uniref:relaxase/mobilization nuclease domain-containing protein n=1 Tax=Dysosmobacter sp. TaxID=2591382 RepID=UPI002F95896B
MAITKIIAIRDRLDKRVNYAVNGEKTTLDTGITYAANPEKTEQHFFTSAINCESCETAFAEMQATKQRFGKLGGVVGYHFIQSFAPGEVTPEQAHAIGVVFARRLFGDRYEVVIGTHLDKAHLHNHVVVNSVSFVDGKKYHSSPGSYYFEVRSTSDILCRENDLSTITPQGKGKHYAEWKAENTGKPTIRSIIRGDIDRFVGEAYTYETFLMLLRREGYVVQNRPDRKYVTVLPPGGKRAIRLDSLGDGYTEQDIRRRLAAQRAGGAQAVPNLPHKSKRYRIKGKHSAGPKRKITGFYALYLRYLYLLRGTHRKKHFRRVPFSVRQEVVRLERYDRQFRYLWANGMTTAEDLEQRIAALEREIYDGEQQRKPLYRERRDAEDEAYKTQCSAEIDRQTAALREKRRELALCRRILEDVPLVSRQVQQAEAERREEVRKEAQKREYQR